MYCFIFFFNDTATTEIYTLSLHDALPISYIQADDCSWFELDGSKFKLTLPEDVSFPVGTTEFYIEGDARYFCYELTCSTTSVWHCLDISFIAPCDSICAEQNPGDVNDNQFIELGDVIALNNYLNGTNPSPKFLFNCDVNGDCVIDSFDSQRIFSHLNNPVVSLVDCTCINPDTCSFQTAGDFNADALIDYTDLFLLSEFLYNDGPRPSYLANADVNGDCRIDNNDFESLELFLDGNGDSLTDCTCTQPLYHCSEQMPGDFNSDGNINVLDIVFFGKYIFGLGPEPTPLANADANGDCMINIGDALHVINYIALKGPPPVDCTCQKPEFMIDCCWAMRGNIDYDPDEVINISDIVYLVAYCFQGGPKPLCMEEADVNASGGERPINVSDLVYLVASSFQGGPAPHPCK